MTVQVSVVLHWWFLGMDPGSRRVREREDGCSVPAVKCYKVINQIQSVLGWWQPETGRIWDVTEWFIKSSPFWDGASLRWGEFGMQSQPGCRELGASSHPALEVEHPQDLLERPHPLGVWL